MIALVPVFLLGALVDAVAQATVQSGSSYPSTKGKVHKVESVKVHQYYTPASNDYDVAVVKVDSQVPFNDNEIVQLVESDTVLENNEPLSVYGWDDPLLRENTFYKEVLPLYERDSCNRFLTGSYNPVKLVTERMLCTQVEPLRLRTANYGSPILSDDKKQVAIHSWKRQMPYDIVQMVTNLANKEIHDFIKGSL